MIHCHSPSPLPNQALLLLRKSTTLRQTSFSSMASGFFIYYLMNSVVSRFRKQILLTIFLVNSNLISLCLILYGGRSASGSLTSYYYSSYSIVSYIFEIYYDIKINKNNVNICQHWMQFIFFRQVISEPQNNQIYANIDFFALNLLM